MDAMMILDELPELAARDDWKGMWVHLLALLPDCRIGGCGRVATHVYQDYPQDCPEFICAECIPRQGTTAGEGKGHYRQVPWIAHVVTHRLMLRKDVMARRDAPHGIGSGA